MTSFSHWFPQQQVLFGRSIAAHLREPLARIGISRPFFICSPRAAADPGIRAIVAPWPADTASIWDGVRAHAPLHAAIEGAAAARAHRADAIVSIGGGSASDLAKGIALVLAEGDDIEPYALRREAGAAQARTSTAAKLPIGALPTTLSGAEVTPGFSLTRADTYKLIFRDAAVAARLVVLDPDLIACIPERVLAGSGMNAIAHCCEAIYSKARTPISSLLAADGLKRLWQGLGHRASDHDRAEELLVGAYLAAAAIVNARTALHHAICHKLAPMAGISHGEANAAVLPYALGFNLRLCPQETVQIAQAMGLAVDDKSEEQLITTITSSLKDFTARAGLHARLRDFGLERTQLTELSQRVFAEPGLAFNPRRIESAREIEELLRAAW